jgi:hypothetical protein
MAKKKCGNGIVASGPLPNVTRTTAHLGLLIFFQIFSAEMCRTDEGLQRAHHVATTHNENEMA